MWFVVSNRRIAGRSDFKPAHGRSGPAHTHTQSPVTDSPPHNLSLSGSVSLRMLHTWFKRGMLGLDKLAPGFGEHYVWKDGKALTAQ